MWLKTLIFNFAPWYCRGAILFWGNFSFCLRVFGWRNALRVYSSHKPCINMQIYV